MMEPGEELEPYSIIELTRPIQEVVEDEHVRQAKVTFAIAVGAMIVGTVVLLAGVVGLFLGGVAPGALSTGSGVVLDGLSLITLRFLRAANDRLDVIRLDASALRLISQIQDPVKRDDATVAFAQALLKRGTNPQS